MPTVGKYGKITFSPEDHAFIKKNWQRMTNPELATALGLNLTRLRNELRSLGLKRMELEYWTNEQVDFLRANFRELGDVELAEYFGSVWPKAKGWTHKHIEKKRKYLRLKRTPEEIAKIKARNICNGRFKICAIKRWKTTGQPPIGEMRIWKKSNEGSFVVIKTVDGWKHYNRWLWEQHHGKLKSDQLVVPKDGVKLICELQDLEVIDRQEHAFRNSTKYHLYPDDVKKAIKLKNQIFKELENEQ